MPLHGLEAGQVLHLGVALFVLCPHAEGTLHQQAAQVGQVALKKRSTNRYLWSDVNASISFQDVWDRFISPHLVSCDGDEVHRVIYSFQDPQDGGERLL